MRDARFGSDDLDDCRSFGIDDSISMEVVLMLKQSTQRSIDEEPRLRKSETLLVVVPKWMVLRTVLTTLALATLYLEMRSATRPNSASRVQ